MKHLCALAIFSLVLFPALASSGELSTWEWRYPSPQGNDLRRVIFANGSFLSGGYKGALLSSADGTTWEKIALNPAASHGNLIFGNGIYLSSNSNVFFISQDGRHWMEYSGLHVNGEFISLDAVVYVNDRFWGFDNGRIYQSYDGINWSFVAYPLSGKKYLSVVDMAYGNGMYVAVVDNWYDRETHVFISADGASWTSTTINEQLTPAGIAFGNGIFVMAGSKCLHTSVDGKTWTKRNSAGPTPTSYNFGAAFFFNGKFYAVGVSGIQVSQDNGATWEFSRRSHGSFSDLFSLAYGNGRYVAVGKGGNIAVSNDGLNWTDVVEAAGLSTLAHGNNRYISIEGLTSNLMASDDGINWRHEKEGLFGNFTHDVKYCGAHFIAVGGSGLPSKGFIAISQDGLSWTKKWEGREAPEAIACGSGAIVLAGGQVAGSSSYGTIWTSMTGGNTWTEKVFSASEAGLFYNILWDGAKFMALGIKGLAYASADGLQWTRQTVNTTANLGNAAFGNGIYVAAYNEEKKVILSSDGGATWNVVDAPTLGPSAYLKNVFFLEGRFVGYTYLDRIVTSTDGVNWRKEGDFMFDGLDVLIRVNGTYMAATGSGIVAAVESPSCEATLGDDLSVRIPSLDIAGSFFDVTTRYDAERQRWEITDINPGSSCSTPSTFYVDLQTGRFFVYIHYLLYQGVSYWAKLYFDPVAAQPGEIWLKYYYAGSN